MNRKLFGLLSVLVLLGMLLGACGGQAPPTEEVAEVEAPQVEEEEPAAEPEEPAAASEADLDAAFETFLADMEAYNTISLESVNELLAEEPPPFLLDVRQSLEQEQVRLEGSRHIPLGNLRSRLHDVPRGRPIVIVCSLGLRSYEASRVLTAHGFEDVAILDGGLDAWPYALERLT